MYYIILRSMIELESYCLIGILYLSKKQVYTIDVNKVDNQLTHAIHLKYRHAFFISMITSYIYLYIKYLFN